MALQVAFLRAINVGNRRVSMDGLREPFEDLGLDEVSTFIASGNVIFRGNARAADLEPEIEDALEETLGFEVTAFVRPGSTLTRIASQDPFPDAPDNLVHVGFLKKALRAPARRDLEGLSNQTDSVTARGREIYWFARNGMGGATLSGAVLEKTVGQPTTLRSLKMLRRLRSNLR